MVTLATPVESLLRGLVSIVRRGRPEIKNVLSFKPGIKFGAHGKLGLEGTRTYKTKGFFGDHSDKKKTFLGVGGKIYALSFGKYTKRDDETRPSLSLSGNYGKTLGKKGFGGKGRLSFGFKKPGTTYSGGFKTNIFAEKGFGNKGKKNLKIGANVNIAGFNVEGKLDPKTSTGYSNKTPKTSVSGYSTKTPKTSTGYVRKTPA